MPSTQPEFVQPSKTLAVCLRAALSLQTAPGVSPVSSWVFAWITGSEAMLSGCFVGFGTKNAHRAPESSQAPELPVRPRLAVRRADRFFSTARENSRGGDDSGVNRQRSPPRREGLFWAAIVPQVPKPDGPASNSASYSRRSAVSSLARRTTSVRSMSRNFWGRSFLLVHSKTATRFCSSISVG